MVAARHKSALLAPVLTTVLVTAGLGAVTTARAVAAPSSSSSCLPAMDSNVGSAAADFTASTAGSGTGNVSIDTGTASFEGTGHLSWSAKQAVTGTSGPGAGTMSGTLNMSVSVNGHAVSFISSCILEAGVFAGESEDDPFDPEDFHTVLRGVEGEWSGTAYNFPAPGKSSRVVASLAAWTTSVGPRFKLDMTTGDFSNPGVCPIEPDTAPGVSAGGPTAPNSNVVVNAPDLQSGFGSCAA